MNRRFPLSALLVIIGVVALRASDPPRYRETGVLTLEDRVWAQARIERVWYEHRTWPKENPAPKPAFADAMPQAVLRARAAEALRQSAALEAAWNDPVTDADLQAELSRMIRESRDPATLRELFAALGNDPFLIAETLVRGPLAERRLRARFAADRGLHAEAFAAARAAYARAGEARWSRASGEYRRTLWIRGERTSRPGGFEEALPLDDAEFAALAAESPAPGGVTPLRESSDGFWFSRTLRKSADSIERETLFFAKRDFEGWWRTAGGAYDGFASGDSRRDPGSFSLSGIGGERVETGGCDAWSPMASFADLPQTSTPMARYYHTIVWTGSEMIVWGGVTASGPSNAGGRYTPATDSWLATGTGSAPAARFGHTAVWTGSVMVIWGGTQSGNGPYYSSGGRYSPTFDTWAATSTGTNVPSIRQGHTAVWTGSLMVVWGGSYTTCPSSCTTTWYGNGGRYDPVGDTWAVVQVPGPPERTFHTAVWTGTYMVVWGGYNVTGGTVTEFNGGGRYDPVANTWSGVSTLNAPVSLSAHSAVWTGGVMVVWGGNHNTNQPNNTGGRYDPVNDVWAGMSTAGAAARVYQAAVWSPAAQRMIVWGGEVSYSASNTGGRYDPVNDVWSATSTVGAPPAARNPVAVWAPERGEMLVWGGQDASSTSLNSGGRYNPVSDSWSPIAVYDGVNSRHYHTAVWTGAEMIVWGGTDGNNVQKGNGGRYSPATNSWTVTASAGAPSPRSNHTAVWSGARMVVWGGYSGNPAVNTGGRYDPTTNSWSPTTLTGAATARGGQTAVWTGTEMIVWGGNSSGTFLNDGARYNPVTDGWTAVAAYPALAGRAGHTAVWTGSEMIVWGGNSMSCPSTCIYTYYNTGGRYSPSGNSWTATSTTGAPSPRSAHYGVLVGGTMVIWEGYDASNTLHNGGRYSVSGNSWSAMTTVNQPAFRTNGIAISTGTLMIAWAGGYLNTGGRYNPAADSWVATSTTGAPIGRQYLPGVWTGNQLIAWGGDGTTPPYVYNNGGIYLFGPDSPGASLRGGKSATIDLTWTASSGATSYNVRRCTASGAFCNPTAVVANPGGTTYNEPQDGNSYYYAVEAVNACGATP